MATVNMVLASRDRINDRTEELSHNENDHTTESYC